MTDLDIKINYIKYRDFQTRQERVQDNIDKLQKERESISARVSSISADNEKDEKRKNDLQHQLFELEKRLHAYKIRVEDIDSKTERNRELIAEQQGRKESIQNKIEERRQNEKNLIAEKTKTEQSGVEIARKIKDDRERLSKFFDTRKRKIESIHSMRDTIEKNKALITEKEEALKKLRDDLEVVIRRLINAIEKRKAELTESEEERNRVKERINKTMKETAGTLQRIRQHLESGIVPEALAMLRTIDLEGLAADFTMFEKYEDGFRSILFDKTGIHAEKETLDSKINGEVAAVDNLREEISRLEHDIRREQDELDDVNGMITRVEKDLSRDENEKDWIEKHLESLERQITDVRKQVESFREDMTRSDRIIENLNREIKEWEERLIEFNERSQSLLKNISEIIEKRSELDKRIQERKSISKKDELELQSLVEKIGALDKSQVELLFKKNSIEDHLWVEYEKKLGDLEGLSADSFQLNDLTQDMQKVKKEC